MQGRRGGGWGGMRAQQRRQIARNGTSAGTMGHGKACKGAPSTARACLQPHRRGLAPPPPAVQAPQPPTETRWTRSLLGVARGECGELQRLEATFRSHRRSRPTRQRRLRCNPSPEPPTHPPTPPRSTEAVALPTTTDGAVGAGSASPAHASPVAVAALLQSGPGSVQSSAPPTPRGGTTLAPAPSSSSSAATASSHAGSSSTRGGARSLGGGSTPPRLAHPSPLGRRPS